MMKINQCLGLLLNLLTNVEKISEDLLKVIEMLLHALSLIHPKLVELLSEKESIDE